MFISTRNLYATVLTFGALALAGCSMTPSRPTTIAGPSIKGSVFGGKQIISGATIQLYKAATDNYAGVATPLISTTVTTSGTGSFNITGKYTCQPDDLLYITATGGNPGVSGTHNNRALALMAGLGRCDGISSSTYISMNEMTTVGTVFALSPFMNDITHVGAPSSNTQGLENAFAAINKLVNIGTGAASGPALPLNATLPVSKLNTLSDILQVCVDSVDTEGGQVSSRCQSVFDAVNGAGSPGTASDTIKIALNLAQSPQLSLTDLNNMVLPTAPFQPTLGSTPPDNWLIAIKYTGGGLNAPKGIAVDASGNVWVPNSGNNSVTKLNNNGDALFDSTVGSLNVPSAIALDADGNVWVANAGNNSISKILPDGLSGASYSGSGLNIPRGIAIDIAGNVWVANSGSASVSEFDSSGNPLSGASGFTGGGIQMPVAVGVNPY